MPGGSAAQFGLVHQHIRFTPNCCTVANLWVRCVGLTNLLASSKQQHSSAALAVETLHGCPVAFRGALWLIGNQVTGIVGTGAPVCVLSAMPVLASYSNFVQHYS